MINEMKLRDLLIFEQGINPSRSKNGLEFYDHVSFEDDLKCKSSMNLKCNMISGEKILNSGDFVFKVSSFKASVIEESNGGKNLSNNFIKFVFKSDSIINKYYLLYMINESKYIRKQFESSAKAFGVVTRISISELAEIKVPIPSFENQKIIGELYFNTLKMNNNIKLFSEKLTLFTNSVIDKKINGSDINAK